MSTISMIIFVTFIVRFIMYHHILKLVYLYAIKIYQNFNLTFNLFISSMYTPINSSCVSHLTFTRYISELSYVNPFLTIISINVYYYFPNFLSLQCLQNKNFYSFVRFILYFVIFTPIYVRFKVCIAIISHCVKIFQMHIVYASGISFNVE